MMPQIKSLREEFIGTNKLRWFALIVVYFVIACIPILLSKDRIINYSDHLFPFDFLDHSYRLFFTWNDYLILGADQSLSLCPSLPYYIFFSLFQLLGFPIWITNRLEFILPIFLAMVGQTLLMLEFTKSKQKDVFFVSSIAFIASFIFVTTLGQGLSQIIMVFAQIPFVVWVTIKISQNFKIRYFLIFIISSLFIPSANISYTVVSLICIISFLCLYSLIKRDKTIFLYLIVFILTFIISNLYWILPTIYTIFIAPHGIDLILGQKDKLEHYTAMVSSRYDLANILFLLPNINVIIHQNGISPLTSFYNSFFVRVSFIILSISILYFSLLNSKKNRSIILISIILFLCGLFMLKGNNLPFGDFYPFLMQFSVFKIMREPLKWMILPAFAFSILLGIVYETIDKKIVRLLIIVLLMVMLIPYTTGIFGVLQGYDVPNYYFEFKEDYKTGDGKIFILNSAESPDAFKWDPTFKTSNILKFLSPVPTIDQFSPGTIQSKTVVGRIYNNITKTDEDLKFFAILNVETVVLQKDKLNVPLDYNYSHNYFNKYSYGDLELYQLNKEYSLPLLFAINPDKYSLTTFKNKSNMNIELINLCNYDFPKRNDIIDKTVEISYQRANPTKYYIDVHNSSSTFILVFLTTYSPHWEIISPPGYNDKSSHLIINDYANGWVIDPAYIKANYPKKYYNENPDGSIDTKLVLYYKPQSYTYIGFTILGLMFIGCFGYLFWNCRKRKVAKL